MARLTAVDIISQMTLRIVTTSTAETMLTVVMVMMSAMFVVPVMPAKLALAVMPAI